jgi:hypothetical protein
MEYLTQHTKYKFQNGFAKVARRSEEACDDASILKDTEFFEDL